MTNRIMTVPPWDIEDPDLTPWEASAYQAGAAAAFGLTGMAEAIRVSDLQRKSPTGCRVCPPSSYCHHCGAVWWSCLCPDRD